MEDKYNFDNRWKLIEASDMPAYRWIRNEREAVLDYVKGAQPGFVTLLMKSYLAFLDEIIRRGVSYSENTSVDLLRVIDKVNKQRQASRTVIEVKPIAISATRPHAQSKLTNAERIEANREQLFAWAAEGKAYFWMAKEIGINDRNASAVSQWFLKQGIRRKAAK